MATEPQESDQLRRLLDMLAGWAAYVDKCVECPGTCESCKEDRYEASALADMYQLVVNKIGLDPPPGQVTEFIMTQVIPFVLAGPPSKDDNA